MERSTISHQPSAISNNKGMTLLFIVILLMLVASIVTAGIAVIGSLTKRTKITETNSVIDADIKSVVSYAATNHRLPTTAQIAAAMKKSNDAWGNQIIYIVDNNLTSIPAGSYDAICGRRTANLTIRNCTNAGCTTYTDIPNVAFLILSGGENVNNQTAATQAATAATVINVYSAGLNVDNYAGDLGGARAEPYDDVAKWITLDELKNRVGCYGTAQGRLKILNNELPDGCPNAYNAYVYADGGVPFTTGGRYKWCVDTVTGGIGVTSPTSATDCTALPENDAHWVQGDNLPLSVNFTTQGSLKVHLRDNNDPAWTGACSDANNKDNCVQKQFQIKSSASCGPTRDWSFDDPANLGGAISGGVTSTTGISGNALQFTGTTAVFTPDNQGFNNSTFSFEYNQPFSIVMWVKLTKLPTTAPASLVYPLVSKGGAAPAYSGYYFEIHSSAYNQPAVGYNRLVFQLTNQWNGGAGPMVWVYNTTAISTINTWYHIAATYNGNGLASGAKVYVSGGSANATHRDNLANGSIVNTQPLRFGDYGQNYYNSVVMDGIQIYNKMAQQLRVIKAGTGSGTVASSLFFRSPERINCGSICEAYYPNGTIVALGASANTGSTFREWSDPGCPGTETCLITITGDTNITATFSSP